VRADGLLVVPAGLEGHHAGELVDVLLMRGVGEIERTIVAWARTTSCSTWPPPSCAPPTRA
jgi:hypothetical protein